MSLYVVACTCSTCYSYSCLGDDQLFEGKRPHTGECEAYFKCVNEYGTLDLNLVLLVQRAVCARRCVAVGGSQGPESYCLKNVQLTMHFNSNKLEKWRGDPSYHILFYDVLVELNRLCRGICSQLPFEQYEPIQSQDEASFFFPRPSLSSSPKPQFNTELVEGIIKSLEVTEIDSKSRSRRRRITLHPLSTHTLALPLFNVSGDATLATASLGAETHALQLRAGQPLPKTYDPLALFKLKAAEFM